MDVLKTWAWARSSQIMQRNCYEDAKGGARIYEHVVRTSRLLLIKENLILQVKELRAFPCMERCRVWAHCNHSLDRHLSSLGQCPVLSQPESPQGAHPGFLEQVTGKWLVVFFPSCVPFRA